MGNSLIFKAGLDDGDIMKGLKRMEDNAAKTGDKMGKGLSEAGKKAHGQTRQLGDVLDVVTGQYGGVMKMNAAVHTLGLGLGAAFAGVGVAMLGEKVFEDTEKVRELNAELKKIEKTSFSASATSMSELGKRMEETQKVKEGFEESAGTKPGQTRLTVMGRTLLNIAADALTPGSNTTLAGRHADAAKLGAEEAQKMEDQDAKSMTAKMQEEIKIQADMIAGRTLAAALAKDEAETQERIGALMAVAVKNKVDMKDAAQAELDLQKQRVQQLQKADENQRFAAAWKNRQPFAREDDQADALEIRTQEARRENLEKHLTLRQRQMLIRKDFANELGMDTHTPLGIAQKKARLIGDINEARELAARRAMMSPHERAQQARDERRQMRAADHEEERMLKGASKFERLAFQEQKNALKNAVKNNATIDDGSIAKLAGAIKDAVDLLIAK